MRLLIIVLALTLSACGGSDPEPAPDADAVTVVTPVAPDAGPDAEEAETDTLAASADAEAGSASPAATTVADLCAALAPALTGTTDGLGAYAAPNVLADLSGSMYESLDARDGSCFTEAGDAYVFLGIEDRGERGLFATEIYSRAAGEYAYAPTRETCTALAGLLRPAMDTGTAWREHVGVHATEAIARELRDLDDPDAILTPGDGVCVVSSDAYGDAENVLQLASTDTGMMAVLGAMRLAGEAANY